MNLLPRVPPLALLAGLACLVINAQARPNDRDTGAMLPNPTSFAECKLPPRLELTASKTLEPNCIYHSTFMITRSGVDLDCRGSVIDPGHLKGYALHIDSRGEPLSDVTVRNCVIRNSAAISLVIGWKASDRQKLDQYSREEVYRRTPRGVKILNTRIENSKGSAIYVDDFVSDTLIKGVTVTGSETVAVYLEHSSRRTTIESSLFEGNSVARKREALAIDSSTSNVIRNNIFRRNTAGGIFLYKNCFEHARTNRDQVERVDGADDNLIEGNVFEEQPVGVWIGSRQSRDLRSFDCGKPYYGGKFVLDHANNNTVQNNYFRAIDRAVVVEDDRNVVHNNTFEDIRVSCVAVGTERRSKLLSRPVVGVTVDANRCRLRRDNVRSQLHGKDKGIEYLHGSKP